MFDWLFGRKKEPELIRPEPDACMTPSIDTERLESQVDSLSQQIARLMNQTEALREQLDWLDHRTSFGNDQLETVTRYLSDVAGWADPLDRRLAELLTWAEQSREGVAQLEEGIRKLSRTQFRTNSLAEAQQERLQSALETLQDLAARKQEAAEKARQRQREAVEAARREARLVVATDLFPALDGLESALESGRVFLERSRLPAAKPGFLTRLAYAFGLGDLPAISEDTQALAAWLDGLELVRERFLALLRAEGIQPIQAEGQPFDPHRHVAVEAIERPDAPPGTVVEEHRPGYRLGDRVLRYAEVVVARDGVEPRFEEPEGTEEPKEPAEAWEPAGKWEPWQSVVGDQREAPEPDQPEEAGEQPEQAPGGNAESFDKAQDRPLEEARDRPPFEAQDRPFEAQDRPFEAQDRPFEAQDRPFDQAQDRPPSEAEDRPAEEVKEERLSQDAEDDTRTDDPEIEEMVARFEARRRARRS